MEIENSKWYTLPHMKRSEIIFGLIRIPVDMLAVFAGLLLAYELRAASIDLLPNLQLLATPVSLPTLQYYLTNFTLPWTGVYVVIAALLQLYALKTTFGPWREMGRVSAAVLLWLAGVIAWFFLVEKQLFFSRALLLQAVLLMGIFLLLGRTVIFLIQRMCLRRGIGVRTVLSCGALPLSAIATETLERDRRFRFGGHVSDRIDVEKYAGTHSIDLVLHTDPNPSSAETLNLIEFCRSHHIGYAFLPPVFADVPHQLSVDHLGLTPMLRFEPTPLDGWGRVFKRGVDLVLGTLLLILFSPILLLIAVIILMTNGWPIFYVSSRVGQYGKHIVPLLKFRTMCRDADQKKPDLAHLSHRNDGPLFKIKDDPRVTKVGRVLRRLSLDELPQLLNVIAGHLSLVGPRPHLPDEVARYTQSQRRVFTVRPGVTGLAQISGRSNLPFNEEVQLDMRYIEDWSMLLDFWVLWRTVFVVLMGRGAD